MWKVFRLSPILVIIVILVALCLQPKLVHAQVYGPQKTYLVAGNYGNYYFSPTYLNCHVGSPCIQVTNRTGRNVLILNRSGSAIAFLYPNQSFFRMFFVPGVYTFTDRQNNIRIPLTIRVYGGFSMYPGGGGYPGYGPPPMWYRIH